MRRTIAGFMALAMLVGAGCSLTTDLSGFTLGSDAGVGPSGDGATSTPASPTVDGSTSPSPTPPTPDAGASVDGAAPKPCDGTHFFCTDFDKRPLAEEWDLIAPSDGTIDRNMGASQSAPYSLEMTHPVGNVGAPFVQKTVAGTNIGGLKCSFGYRRDAVDEAGVLVVLMADFNTVGSEHLFAEIKDGKTKGRVYIAVTKPDGSATDDFPEVPTFSTPALGAWAKVEWTLDLRGKQSTLRSDGKLVDQRPFGAFTPANLTSVKLTLGLGNFTAPTSAWRVRYDDLVCDALP